MKNDLIQGQLNYYRARATEYDASLQPLTDSALTPDRPMNREWTDAIQAVRALGPCGRVLELAAGTGIWTRELVPLAADLTVLDGAPEMLEINRTRTAGPHVHYECADLFTWEPKDEYDLVFFAFWLSHVPPDRLDPFLDKIQRATALGGRVFIVDEPAHGQHVSGPAEGGMYQQRTLQDGRVFDIVKMYYDPVEIQKRLDLRGFLPEELKTGEYFFHMVSKKSDF